MILVSAAGSGGTNGLLETFTGDVIGITSDKYKIFASKIKKNILVPHASNEKEYINKINKIIEEYKVDLFIPNSELEVFVVTKYIDQIKTKTFLPSFEIVNECFDKWKLHEKMQRLSVSSAKTFRIFEEKYINMAFDQIKSRPLWCRVKNGAGSKYTSKVFDKEDARFYVKHCCKAYSLEQDSFLISEYLPGEDYAVMSIWREGAMKLCKMAKRTRYDGEPGESPPTILESFYDKKIEEFVRKSVKRLFKNPHGILNVDIKCFEDLTPAITEINAGRFYYNMQLFNYGDVNAFKVFLDLANNKDIEFKSDDPEIIFIREQDNEPKIILKREINE